jgi:hypothetical protein
MSAPFSPIMIEGALVFPEGITGMIEESTTRNPPTLRTRSSGSTTDLASLPIRQQWWEDRAASAQGQPEFGKSEEQREYETYCSPVNIEHPTLYWSCKHRRFPHSTILRSFESAMSASCENWQYKHRLHQSPLNLLTYGARWETRTRTDQA